MLERVCSKCQEVLCACRRHIQLQSSARLGLGQMAVHLWQTEGFPGFYRGFIPSAIKNLPNKGKLFC